MNEKGLVYIGKVVSTDPIDGADFIMCATVVCGDGGRWKGVVKKSEIKVGDLCTVYLPDSLIPCREDMKFMESSGWRVRMRRFKGAPSEVVIMPLQLACNKVGTDCTHSLGVTRYYKPIPISLQGKAKADFPSFVPKTDEPNYQSCIGMVNELHGLPFYITEKVDGSSTTAFKYQGSFGVCSRNWEIEPDENIGYWTVSNKYQLHKKLPEGIALQWETCGPKIQGNPLDLKETEGYAFSAYDIDEREYLEMRDFLRLCKQLRFPVCAVVDSGTSFDKYSVERLGEGSYANGKPREGVVVRSTRNMLGHKPISFKVINLAYDK